MAVCLTVCLAAAAVIGGTLAYFIDTDGAGTGMTVGGTAIDYRAAVNRMTAAELAQGFTACGMGDPADAVPDG